MHRVRSLLALLLAAATLSGTGVVLAGPASADVYNPPPGMLLNNPLSSSQRWVINNHLVRTINSVPKGGIIRIATWNLGSTQGTNALINAHKRGVSVRLLMASGNRTKGHPNPNFNKLQQALTHNAGRKGPMASFARLCQLSCRGPKGTAHAKIYLFSQSAATHDITMWGSANLTRFAATGQWNDLFTVRNNARLYNWTNTIYNQMAADKPLAYPLRQIQIGSILQSIFPWRSQTIHTDPIMRVLTNVTCHGATGGTGTKGRTKIRIAINAQLGQRGANIAAKVHRLYDAGCDVKVVYGQFGATTYNNYESTSGRGKVPIRHIVQDFNHDGIYDRYLHMKAIAISGVYGKQTDAHVTAWGSANWSPLAIVSDETMAITTAAYVEEKDSAWITHLFNNPPKYNTVVNSAAGERGIPVNPYAHFDND